MKLYIYSWILNYLYVQLFVTLISLPLLVLWGLPFSILSPLGNLIFTPFLSIFLCLSSLLFFASLFALPTAFLSTLINYVTDIWFALMNQAPYHPYIGFFQPHWLILLLIPCLTILIFYHPYTRTKERSCLAALLLLLSIHITFFALSCPRHITQVARLHDTITLLPAQQGTILVDPGIIGQRPSGKQWAQYELVRAIVQDTGSYIISDYILLQPTATALYALEKVCHHCTVGHIIMPSWQGHNKSLNRAWMTLKKTILRYGIPVSRISEHKGIITLRDQQYTISSLNKILNGTDYSYQACKVSGTYDNQPVEIYPCKYKKSVIKNG